MMALKRYIYNYCRASIVAERVNEPATPGTISEHQFESRLCSFQSISLPKHLGGQQRMTQLLRPLPPTWETWLGLLVPGFKDLAQLWPAAAV